MMRVHAVQPFSISSLNDLEFEAPDNPDVHIDGRGRVYGIVLTQDHARRVDTKSDNDGPVLMLVRYGMCGGRGCVAVRGGVNVAFGFGPGLFVRDNHTMLLRAGDYDLYLLTDGSPVTARLTLHGLSGTSRLHPSIPVTAPLAEAVPIDARATRYTSDERHAFHGLGLIAVSVLTRSDTWTSPHVSYWLSDTTGGESSSADDAVNAETPCADKAARMVAGQEDRWWAGAWDNSGQRNAADWPYGKIHVYSSFDPAIYRNQLTVEPTPADDSRSFTTLWLPGTDKGHGSR